MNNWYKQLEDSSLEEVKFPCLSNHYLPIIICLRIGPYGIWFLSFILVYWCWHFSCLVYTAIFRIDWVILNFLLFLWCFLSHGYRCCDFCLSGSVYQATVYWSLWFIVFTFYDALLLSLKKRFFNERFWLYLCESVKTQFRI